MAKKLLLLGGDMRKVLRWVSVGVVIACVLSACNFIAEVLNDKLQSQRLNEEKCIYLKYQKEAEKFLDMDCQRYVRYKQDNK